MKSIHEKILLVDDDPAILKTYAAILGRGFNMETAEDGQSALEIIRSRGPFAVVIADYQMPGIDGLALLCEVKNITPGTVCMLHSGAGTQEIIREALREGTISRFIAKPCNFDELASAIREGMAVYTGSDHD